VPESELCGRITPRRGVQSNGTRGPERGSTSTAASATAVTAVVTTAAPWFASTSSVLALDPARGRVAELTRARALSAGGGLPAFSSEIRLLFWGCRGGEEGLPFSTGGSLQEKQGKISSIACQVRHTHADAYSRGLSS
jgi:hypothetical protein